ncbi:MAG: metal ABC transporter substrate-binding protein [Dermabacter sp.]|nr:metal ABC transporter substrate-binding protein [Dermabacter sp.]
MTARTALSRRSFALATGAGLLATLAACSGTTSGTGAASDGAASDGGSKAGALRVMVTTYPTHYLAASIGGSLVSIENPVKPGVDPHGLELSVQQVAQMSTAGLVLQIEHYQSAVDTAISSQHLTNVLNLNEHVTLLPASAAAEDETDHDHDQAEDDHDHDHDHGDIDPHFWHDPLLMIEAATAIAARLSEIAPEHKDAFAEALATLTATLTTLDEELSAAFGAVTSSKEFITSHAAFTYLAHRYGLTQIAIAGIDPDTEPSTQRLLELSQLVQSKGLSTVFFETTASPAVAETLATRSGVKAEELDNLETQLDPTKDYAEVMRNNSVKLVASWA